MNGLSPVREYRLLDVLYGQVERTDLVRDELLRLRREQLETRAGGLKSSLAVVLLFLASAVPALWQLLPTDMALKRWCIIGVVIGLAVIQLWLFGRDLYENCREKNALAGKLREEPDRALEDQPEYIMIQIASWGTGLSVAGDVLRSEEIDETTRAKFSAADGYCRERVRDELDRATKLHKEGKLTDEEHDGIREWGRIALQQRSRQKDNASE